MSIAKRLPQKNSDYLRLIAGLMGVLLVLQIFTFLYAEGLWFQEVDYLQVFLKRIYTQVIWAGIPFVVSLSVLLGNLVLANRQAWAKPISEKNRLMLPGYLRFRRLLPLVVAISITIGIIMLHHGQIAVRYWQPNQSIYTASSIIPVRFRPSLVWQIVQSWQAELWQPILVLGLTLLLLLYPRSLLSLVAVLVSTSFGLILAEQWSRILLAFNSVPFEQTDPIFGRDISFFAFSLPFWELIEFWFVGLSALTLLSVGLIYLLSGDSLSQGYFPGFSAEQQRHLMGLSGFLMLAVALSYWLDRYSLLFSATETAYGATFIDVNARLPAYTVLCFVALGIAAWLLWRAFFTPPGRHYPAHIPNRLNVKPVEPAPAVKRSNILSRSWQTLNAAPAITKPTTAPASPRLILVILGLYTIAATLAAYVLPLAVQRLLVQPNELQLERPFLQNTIAFSRQAFDLTDINVETFDPENTLTFASLQENELTIRNIRLWDTRPLLQTNRQLQRIRLYYEFPDADIDRYTLPTEDGILTQQQVLISPRELDYASVPEAAQTWVNKHLIYTHGYGFTMSPVNIAGEGGLPDYLVRGIEPVAVADRVRNSIPIGKPRIYYGELADTYVMTRTGVQELDYPSGSDNVYNVYDGRGGVEIGGFWQRLLFSKQMLDWRMLLTDNFTPQTKLLFRRNINSRVRAIAPFLRYDNDPYLVVADTGGKSWERGYQRSIGLQERGSEDPDLFPESVEGFELRQQTPDESYLYWIIDAYTISDRYPYSDPGSYDFNYIRNSVKVVIDAYHGSVNFYVANPTDPVIQSWQRIFPGVFQPLAEMPVALRNHIRYPQDLYQVQSERLMTYHMTDPVVFYNREDQWRAPNEIYGNRQQPVQPYYLITKLPSGQSEEFILLQPFTPVQRNNLIAWLAGRSDGAQYGKMLLYSFPKQKLVYGPEQIEARINQDPIISEQISLWNRQGSRAIQGNLLVVPIEESLLYVEPLYLEAEQNSLPTLVRVIVVYGSRIVMAESLQESLRAIFEPPPDSPAIVRPVEEVIPDAEANPDLELAPATSAE